MKIRVKPVLDVVETSVKGDDETNNNELETEFKQSVDKMANGLRTVNKELLSLEKRSELQRGKEQAMVFEPSPLPEPPDADLCGVANEIHTIQAVSVELRPPPELPNTDFCARISSTFDMEGGKEKRLVLKLQSEPPDTDSFAVVMEDKHIGDVTNKRNEIAQILVAPTPPIEPPDTSARVVVTDRNSHASTTEKQVAVGQATTPPPPEPPDCIGLTQCKILSTTVDSHLHQSIPSILPSNDFLHVSSSGQCTSPLLSHVSPIGYPLPPTSTTCHVYTRQTKASKIIECDLSQFHNQVGQTQCKVEG
jgi:hypothetical protein